MKREITKVKRLNDLTTVEWSEPNGAHRTEAALNDCPDTPSKDFLDQFATVEADLLARAGYGKKFGEAFQLTGISMGRNRANRRQFTATGKIDLGWGSTGVTLPLLLEPDLDRPATDNVLSDAELKNIEQLFREAAAYAGGEREQGELKLDAGAADSEDGESGESEAPADPFAQPEGDDAESGAKPALASV